MGGCVVPNCGNRFKDCRLFKFPKDDKRRDAWIASGKLDPKTVFYYSRICEAHFDENQFEQRRKDGWKRLKCNAIPTLFSPPIRVYRIKQDREIKKEPLNATVCTEVILDGSLKRKLARLSSLELSSSSAKWHCVEDKSKLLETKGVPDSLASSQSKTPSVGLKETFLTLSKSKTPIICLKPAKLASSETSKACLKPASETLPQTKTREVCIKPASETLPQTKTPKVYIKPASQTATESRPSKMCLQPDIKIKNGSKNGKGNKLISCILNVNNSLLKNIEEASLEIFDKAVPPSSSSPQKARCSATTEINTDKTVKEFILSGQSNRAMNHKYKELEKQYDIALLTKKKLQCRVNELMEQSKIDLEENEKLEIKIKNFDESNRLMCQELDELEKLNKALKEELENINAKEVEETVANLALMNESLKQEIEDLKQQNDSMIEENESMLQEIEEMEGNDKNQNIVINEVQGQNECITKELQNETKINKILTRKISIFENLTEELASHLPQGSSKKATAELNKLKKKLKAIKRLD